MDDDQHMAFAVLALCDALALDGRDYIEREKSTQKARKHAHAILSRYKDKPALPGCTCPEHGPCDCESTCVCAGE
jgi:hypothetical protein